MRNLFYVSFFFFFFLLLQCLQFILFACSPVENKAHHIKVQERADGKYFLDPKDGYFDTLEATIKFYLGSNVLETGRNLDVPLEFHSVLTF